MELNQQLNIKEIEAIYESELSSLMHAIEPVFYSASGRENACNYIKGLLSSAERKNSWQLAECLGQETPYGIQQFLYRGRWNPDVLRDRLSDYICSHLGEEEGVLVVDETGFLKKGGKSCGVARQYSGTAGKIANCQIGVFLSYATSKGFTLLDGRLYLPKTWAENSARREEAGVPEDVVFQTKPQMALSMLQHAHDRGVPFTWVTGDSVYGDYRAIRIWLETQGKNYVLCVSGKEYVWQGFYQHRVSDMLERLPEDVWFRASAGKGSKGERLYDWAVAPLNDSMEDGFARFLLVRRSIDNPAKMRAYVCHAPRETPAETLIEIAGLRWTVETSFAESKGLVGLDQYEVRSYPGWRRHIALACAAHALLTVLRAQTATPDFQTFSCAPTGSSLEAFKRGRNLHP